ncbi:MAG: multicopper oxidase domain-containing protein [Thaumarchaeota archaeon]|nr:multicopper oxidase domain-containing protein [Nitrososphaerota archaeon]
MQEWGFIVDGQAAPISSDRSLKGGLPITVKVGDVVQITLINKGKIVHDFNIALGEGEHQHHAGMEHQAESMTLNPGETQIFTFVAEKAGEYTYHCGIPGHTELGMVSSFIVLGEEGGHDQIEHDDGEPHEEEEHHHEE